MCIAIAGVVDRGRELAKMNLLVLLCGVALAALQVACVAVQQQQQRLELGSEWLAWRHRHDKTYFSQLEELERFVVWQANRAYIAYHNTYADRFGYRLEMNQFGDMTSEEYNQFTNCVETTSYDDANLRAVSSYFDPLSVGDEDIPKSLDWREEGVVTHVKNQGWCKSCYAFAMAGALESMHARVTRNLVPLSEQNIIDCSVPYGNWGCAGGSREASVMYVVDNDGIDKEDTYPYIAKQYLCRFTEETVGGTCTGLVRVRSGRETDLQLAVAIAGPVTVAVDARHTGFQFYSGGVYNQPSCSTRRLTHTMLVVGYGSFKGEDYWLVKNSWGGIWGIGGYIMMSRNSSNQCGIATRALYPTI